VSTKHENKKILLTRDTEWMRILVRSESKEDELTEEEDKLKDADFKT